MDCNEHDNAMWHSKNLGILICWQQIRTFLHYEMKYYSFCDMRLTSV